MREFRTGTTPQMSACAVRPSDNTPRRLAAAASQRLEPNQPRQPTDRPRCSSDATPPAIFTARICQRGTRLCRRGPHSPGRPRISAHFQLKRWPLVALKSGGTVPLHFRKWVGGGYAYPLYQPKITPMPVYRQHCITRHCRLTTTGS